MLQANTLLRRRVVQLFSRDGRLNDHYEISPKRVKEKENTIPLFYLLFLKTNSILVLQYVHVNID